MKTITFTKPDFALLIGTRVAIGVGVGLLVSRKLSREARFGAGWALLSLGALTTIPILANVLGKMASSTERGESARIRPAEARA